MAGKFRTTVEEMRAYGARVDQVNRDIQTELARVKGVVAALEGAWRGEARTAYALLQKRWDEDAAALNAVLGEIRRAIEETTRSYGQAEREQAGVMSRISAVLG
jgi:WXG100 family type VII secretion target